MEPNMPTGETMSDGDSSGTEASTTVEGQEKENSSSLSPEFIKMAHSLIDDASAEQIQYIMDCCNEESSEGAPDAESSEKPEMYSSDDMPKD
jgi:hypothetical protein